MGRKLNFADGFTYFAKIIFIGFICGSELFAQEAKMLIAEENSTDWLYFMILAVAAVTFGITIVRSIKTKNHKNTRDYVLDESNSISDTHIIDIKNDLSWFQPRLAKSNKQLIKTSNLKSNTLSQQNDFQSFPERHNEISEINDDENPATAEAKMPQKTPIEKLEELYLYKLPVFSFGEVLKSKPFEPLPFSDDADLSNAIESAFQENEHDAEIRKLTIKILAAFRTCNSVEALSEIALYDLSTDMRIKAIHVLADFNHESVFGTILLAFTDPAREVRTAAARGIATLSINRTDAWARILEEDNINKIKKAAFCAIEAGFLERSINRLIDPEPRFAYEAYVLLALMIKAEVLEKIFDAVKNHPSLRVRKALLHVLKLSGSRYVLSELGNLLQDKKLPKEIKTEIDLTIESVRYAITFPKWLKKNS